MNSERYEAIHSIKLCSAKIELIWQFQSVGYKLNPSALVGSAPQQKLHVKLDGGRDAVFTQYVKA